MLASASGQHGDLNEIGAQLWLTGPVDSGVEAGWVCRWKVNGLLPYLVSPYLALALSYCDDNIWCGLGATGSQAVVEGRFASDIWGTELVGACFNPMNCIWISTWTHELHPRGLSTLCSGCVC